MTSIEEVAMMKSILILSIRQRTVVGKDKSGTTKVNILIK